MTVLECVTLPIVEKRKRSWIIIIALWGSGTIFMFVPLFTGFGNIISIIIGSIGLALLIISMVISWIIKKFSIIGKLIIQVNSVIIAPHEYKIEELSNIVFTYWGYEGQPFPYAITASGSPKTGGSNYFEFTHCENRYKYEVFVASNSWVVHLTKIFMRWKEQGVNIQIKGPSGKAFMKYLERL